MRRAILPLLLAATSAAPAMPAWAAQPPAPPAAIRPASAPVTTPATVESYYRIRWGSFWDFMAIYREHHAPILAEMQRLGLITAIRTETPTTHMAGDQRWDLRVTITYRDGNAALGSDGGAYERAVQEASRRLFHALVAARAARA